MKIFVCDHMRPVARANGAWVHLDERNGCISSPCEAGTYGVSLDNTVVVKKMSVGNLTPDRHVGS